MAGAAAAAGAGGAGTELGTGERARGSRSRLGSGAAPLAARACRRAGSGAQVCACKRGGRCQPEGGRGGVCREWEGGCGSESEPSGYPRSLSLAVAPHRGPPKYPISLLRLSMSSQRSISPSGTRCTLSPSSFKAAVWVSGSDHRYNPWADEGWRVVEDQIGLLGRSEAKKWFAAMTRTGL